MLIRYCYIEPWEDLQNGEHQAVAILALRIAKERDMRLRICVVSLSNCSQFLEKSLGESVSNKLRKRKAIQLNGVVTRLETERTLKKDFSREPAVNLLMFPSNSLLNQVESMLSSKVVIAFSETLNSAHLKEWQDANSVPSLEIQTNKQM